MSSPRFKPVPEPPGSLAVVEEARRAVPLVPDAGSDCCARLQDALELANRQDAEAWLTFLRALELVERKRNGYARTRDDPDREALGTALRGRVVGAEAALDAAASASNDSASTSGDSASAADDAAVDAAFEELRRTVPEWERRRHDDWEAVWRDRTRRLLGWGALFGVSDGAEAPQ